VPFPNLVELLAVAVLDKTEVLLEVPLPMVPENGIGVKLVTASGKTWVQSIRLLRSETPRMERRT
jgi:hypothetical protein